MEKKIYQLLSVKDEYGLELLIKEYENYIRYVITYILGARENDIEECINDTFLKLWQNVDKYDIKKASLKTFLVVIARNTAITKLRSIKNTECHNINIDDTLSEYALEYVDKSSNIEENFIKKENMLILKKLIMNLKNNERELVERKCFYMQSSQDIAKALGIKVTTVDNRLYRIREKLKREFNKQCNNRRTTKWKNTI